MKEYPCSIFTRVESLEASLRTKEKELGEERAKLTTLKNDFKYNLRLLNDRHRELEEYDAVIAGTVSKHTLQQKTMCGQF